MTKPELFTSKLPEGLFVPIPTLSESIVKATTEAVGLVHGPTEPILTEFVNGPIVRIPAVNVTLGVILTVFAPIVGE